MDPPKMMRQCTDESTFVRFNGIDSFRRTFQRNEAAKDPKLAEANTYYEENYGPGITRDDMDAFVVRWGEHYEDNFGPGITKADIESFMARWGEHYDKWFVRKTNKNTFPFEKNLRDYKGTPVPQGRGPFKGLGFDDVILTEEMYIRKHGILNYMIRYKTTETLEELMEIPRYAEHQQAYIRELEYDGLLL